MQYWLLKTEPSTYSWDNLVAEKSTSWTGVRNFQARNNLRAMKKGDFVFIYHSGDEKAVVGTAQVTKEAYPDSTAKEGDWVAVELAAVKAAKVPLTLLAVKKNPGFKDMVLVNNSRLSVQPVAKKEWEAACMMMNI